MAKIYSVEIEAQTKKEISVYCDDATAFEEPIDILTVSAFIGSYEPTPYTIFEALYKCGIDMLKLAQSPEIDLRDPCHIWLSREIAAQQTKLRHIGCIELLSNPFSNAYQTENDMIRSIRSYFFMLDIAWLHGVKMDTVALPLLGSGSQNISPELILVPLINECVAFLKRNAGVQRIYFIEKNKNKALFIADRLKNSLRFISQEKPQQETVKKTAFISYSSKDKNIADNLCAKLEINGIKVWYAPRDVKGAYAESIVQAIDAASLFIVILSQNSLLSEHVLNEIDLAFQNFPKKIKIKPLRIDDSLFTPSFKYYLSRQHWMDATVPPLEERLNEFVNTLFNESEKELENS